MGIIVGEEIGRYDPYTGKFLKNTTCDRIEIGTDGNLCRLTMSNGSESLPVDRLYTKTDMIAMLGDLQAEIEECVDGAEGSPEFEQGVSNARVQVVEMIQERINKLRGEGDGKNI